MTIYVTTAAGGNTDLMARMAAEYLSAKFGKTFVVENRPSAGGVQASGQVVSAAPDGYTLLFTPNSAILLAPLVQKMPFDPDKSLTPVTNVGTGSQVIAVKRSLPVNNLAEFLAYAKANPKQAQFRRRRHQQHQPSRAAAAVRARRRRSRHGAVARRAAGDLRPDGRQRRFLFRQYLGAAGAEGSSGDQAAGGRHRAAAFRARRTSRPRRKPCRALSSRHGTAFWCRTERLKTSSPSSGARLRDMVKAPEMSARLTRLGILPGGQTKEQVAAVFQSDRKNFADAVKAAGIPAPDERRASPNAGVSRAQ